MGMLRAVLRSAAVLLTYAGIGVAGLLVLPLGMVSTMGHRRALVFLMGLWGRCSCFIFNIHCRVEGFRAVQAGGLVVANHIGTPDIFVLASRFPGFFVSKAEIADWPLFNVLARLGQTIFVDRARRHQIQWIVRAIEARIEEGFRVVVFPEGGAGLGEDVFPFKPSVFEAAIRAGRPVVPVSIAYQDLNHPSVACWTEESFVTHIVRLLKNPRLPVTLYVHEALAGSGERRELAKKAEKRIREKFLNLRDQAPTG